ncbi:MAG TPA: hypothetical protein VFQ44_12965 [Streptosporangiaceae bacterium]|nr:hypothetical protein [Streptosporangiaceae bacterium]
MTVFLRGPAYVLGENEVPYTAIENLGELARRFKLAPQPELWGWGTVRVTGRDLADLAAETGRGTMDAAGLPPDAVEAVVLCSNRIPGPAEGHGEFVATVLTGIGLGEIPVYGISLNRCANLLAGIDVAQAFVTSGRHRTVLVITADKVAEDADRMSQFALFSDGAASCLVTAGAGGGPSRYFELLGCGTALKTDELEWSNQISADLAREVNDGLLAGPGLKVGDVGALLHANLFKPLVVMKERQAGFGMGQLFLDNIERLGHCFAADPLINLVDRMALGHVTSGSYCELVTSVPGSRIGVLLRAPSFQGDQGESARP